MCLPEIVRGPHQKDVLCCGCVCRARTSLEWLLHPQHFESVPRHERRVINNNKDTCYHRINLCTHFSNTDF